MARRIAKVQRMDEIVGGENTEWAQEKKKNQIFLKGLIMMAALLFLLFQQQHYVHLCAGVKGLIEVYTPLETYGIYCPGPLGKGQRRGSNRGVERRRTAGVRRRVDTSVSGGGLLAGCLRIWVGGGVLFIQLEHTEIWTRYLHGGSQCKETL